MAQKTQFATHSQDWLWAYLAANGLSFLEQNWGKEGCHVLHLLPFFILFILSINMKCLFYLWSLLCYYLQLDHTQLLPALLQVSLTKARRIFQWLKPQASCPCSQLPVAMNQNSHSSPWPMALQIESLFDPPPLSLCPHTAPWPLRPQVSQHCKLVPASTWAASPQLITPRAPNHATLDPKSRSCSVRFPGTFLFIVFLTHSLLEGSSFFIHACLSSISPKPSKLLQSRNVVDLSQHYLVSTFRVLNKY